MTAVVAGVLAFAGSANAATFVYSGGLIKVGSTGTQVMNLQSCLADMGVNPGSNIDGVFGPITKSAVMAFQTSKSVVVDGIIGPVTGPLYTAACATAGNTNTNTPSEGSEGSVDNYDLGSSEESEALEEESDVEIYAVDVELDDEGDLLLDRVDVWFANSDSASADDDPWEYFKSVALLVDGDEVASMDADSSSDWSDSSDGEIGGTATANEYRMRFSGVDTTFEAGETTTVSIAVTMVDTIDSADQDAIWNVEVDDDAGFKWVDGTGFVYTEGYGDSTSDLEDSFTVGGVDVANLQISTATNDPETSIIEVDDDTDTDEVTIAVIEIEETAGVDATIETIEVTIETPVGADTADIIRKAYLFVDGDEIASESIPAGTQSALLEFDNLGLELDGDDSMDVEIVVDFKDTDDQMRYANGETVQVTVFNITEADDSFGNDEGDMDTANGLLSETASGEEHSLYADGMMVEFTNGSCTSVVVDGGDDRADCEMNIKITAFGEDVYVAKALTASEFDILDSSSTSWLNTGSLVISSTNNQSTEETNSYRVDDGDTATFEVTASTTLTVDASVRALMSQLDWGFSDGSLVETYAVNMGVNGDYKTGYVFVGV